MLTFLHSFFAWALLAAAIPLLIHLLTRKKLKTVQFSTLQFLKRLQKAKIRQVRLKQILLLLLRTLIILCIALAFMRPTLKTENYNLGKKAKSTTVFILDNSLSMAATYQGESLLAQAKSIAMQLISFLEPGDDIAVVEMATTARVLLATNHQPATTRIETAIKQIVQTDGESRLLSALQLAENFIDEKKNLNSNVFIFSDRKFAGFSLDSSLLKNVQLIFFDVSKEKMHNLSVAELNLENNIFAAGHVVEVQARILNTGDFDEKNRIVTLSVNEKRVAQTAVSLKVGREKRVQFKFVPPTAGLFKLQAIAENDQLKQDNSVYNLFSIFSEIDVLLLTRDKKESRFIRHALANSGNKNQFKITEMQPDQFIVANLAGQDVMISCNVPAFDAAGMQKIEAFVRRGGGFLLFLGNDVDLRNYQRTIFSRLHLGSVIETIGNADGNSGSLRLGDIEFENALFTGIFKAQKNARQIDSPVFRFAPLLRPHADSRVLIKYSNGSPLLLQNTRFPGVVFACLTAGDDAWSDFAYKALFAPLIDRMMRLAAQHSQNEFAKISVGTSAEALIDRRKSTAFTAKNPRGIKMYLKPAVEKGKYKLVIRETSVAGFYQLFENESVRFTWAANYNIEEMLQPQMAKTALENAIPEANIEFIDADQNSIEVIQRARDGVEIWSFFLALALAGLLIEMLVYRARPAEN